LYWQIIYLNYVDSQKPAGTLAKLQAWIYFYIYTGIVYLYLSLWKGCLEFAPSYIMMETWAGTI